MILLPEDISESIRLWRRSERDFIGHPVSKTWKNGADLVKSVSSIARRVLDHYVLVSGRGVRVSDVTRGEGVWRHGA